MIINLYAHSEFNEVTIDTEEEHRERIEEAFQEMMAETYSDEFQAFLEEYYSMVEVFNMTEEEKQDVRDNFKDYFVEAFDEREEWVLIEKEIEG